MQTDNAFTPDLIIRLEQFMARLQKQPDPNELDATPDGKAKTLPISFVEMTLDELFFGLWETEKFQWQQVMNEVCGSLELVVTHPITGQKLRRTGAASIVIMVDRAPDNLQGQDRNRWATDPANKKSNALDMGFPKLKAECLKNAAISLGKALGRDINRRSADEYKPLMTGAYRAKMQVIEAAIEQGKVEEGRKMLALLPESFASTLKEKHPALNGHEA